MGDPISIAAVASIGSMALSAGSSVVQGNAAGDKANADLQAGQFRSASDIASGEATQASDEFQAQKAERAAQYGEVQASATDTTMRETTNTTLGNIEAIRASANIDPTSPTTAAILDRNEMLGDRSRMAAVGSIKAQNADDLASADYLRKAGDFAVKMASVSSSADLAAASATSSADSATQTADYLTAGAKLVGGAAKGAAA